MRSETIATYYNASIRFDAFKKWYVYVDLNCFLWTRYKCSWRLTRSKAMNLNLNLLYVSSH